ncbi:MAG: MFS transporter [Bacteroidota bacterium]|nr:MFS transporter [Bacteroidota bacterium]
MSNSKNKWLELVIVLSAPLLSVIDVFIINVAIPAIKKGVHGTDAEIQLVIAGYLLGYAAFLITGGRAGDHFGRKRVFFWGMLCFTLASCLCGLSQNALQLNITRFFQGISASFMVPQTIAYIQILFVRAEERAKAIGFFGITLGIASILGQILGGYLSGTHWLIEGWRLIFFINLPIGIMTLWATHHYLEPTKGSDTKSFDYQGVLILTVALFSLIYPLIEGREKGWPLWSIGLLAFSLLTFAFLVYDQKRKLWRNGNPLIDVRLFRIKDFNIGLVAVLFHFMMHTAFLMISAVYFQNCLGLSALDCGLYFILPGTLFTVTSVIGSRLIGRFGKRVLQTGVLILIITFLLQAAFFKPHIYGWVIFLLMGIYGLGNGLVLPSLLNLALKSVPQQYAGAAAGIYSTFQQTASALGVSIIGGIFFYFSAQGWQLAFNYGIAAIVACLLMVEIMLYFLPDNRQGAGGLHAD